MLKTCFFHGYRNSSFFVFSLPNIYFWRCMEQDILLYIPQRPPFVMIGELVHSDEKVTRTSYTIPADNLFTVNGRFTEPGLVENMAQTAGAGTGYKIREGGGELHLGYIAALKNLNILHLPAVNDTITTEITFQQKLLNFHFVYGKVTCGDKEIANCEFKIFEHADKPGA